MHTGRTDASDFLLVCQEADTGVLRILLIQNGAIGRIRTYLVILSVAHNHAAIQPIVSCRSCRNHLDFRGNKILLLHIVFFLKNMKNIGLYCVFLIRILQRTAADQDIQFFALYSFREFFRHLASGQVDQQVTASEYRIVRILADAYLHRRSVLFHNHSVKRHWKRNPLVFFDSAVIMRIQHGQLGIFV